MKSLAIDPSDIQNVYAGSAGGGVFKSTYYGVCGTSNTLYFDTAPDTNLCSKGSASAVASAQNGWTWTCTGTNSLPVSCSATINRYLLKVEVTDNGMVTGSSLILGIPADINCGSGNSGTCQASYPYGAVVNLLATPPWYTRVNWTGCTATANQCSLVIDMNKTVTAIFSESQNARLGTTYYPGIQAAYNAAISDNTILARDSSTVVFLENLVFDQPYTLTLEGGKDLSWSDGTNFTLVDGSLTIKSGRAVINRVAIR